MRSLWAELRRRKVVRVTIAYAVLAWLLLQVAAIVLPAFDAPDWSLKALVVVLLFGLPLTIVLSWLFDLTPEGVVVTPYETTTEVLSFSHSELSPLDPQQLNLTAPQSTALVGRNKECDLIAKRIAETQQGHGGLVLIHGEPGLGKTRLAEEGLALAVEAGCLPLIGHAYEEQNTPFIVVTEMIEDLLFKLPATSVRNTLGNTASEIARLVPDIRRSFADIPDPIELPPDQQQRYLFNAILEMLSRLGQANPVILFFDDMHWADEHSIQFVEHIAAKLATLPILVLITYRDAELDLQPSFKRALSKFNRISGIDDIALSRFTSAEVSDFLEQTYGTSPPRSLANMIYAETEGNAFFVKAVAQELSEDKQLVDHTGAWQKDINISTIALPDNVRLLIDRRLQRLDEKAREVLAIAAVLGLRFQVRVLEALESVIDVVHNTIEIAENAQLIKHSVNSQELRFEFVHALARQALIANISPPRLQRIHLKIAKVLIQLTETRPEKNAAQIVYHLQEAKESAEPGELIRWLIKAGDQATNIVAMDQAIAFYDRALSIVNTDAERAAILHKRATAELSLGLMPEFQTDMQTALALYMQLGDGANAAHICYELAFLMAWANRTNEAQALAMQGLELIGTDPSPARSRLLSTLGMALGTGGFPDEAKPVHAEAVSIATQIGDQALLAEILMGQSLMYWFNVDGKPLLETIEQAAAIFRKLQQEWNLSQCLWMIQAGLSFLGRFDEAHKVGKELEPIALKHENFGPLLCFELFESMYYQSKGQIDQAIEAGKRSAMYSKQGNLPWAMEAPLSANLILAGNYAEAKEAFSYVSEHRMQGGAGKGSDTAYWLSGSAHFEELDTYQIYQDLEPVLATKERTNCVGPLLLLMASIESFAMIGRRKDVAALYPDILGIVESKIFKVGFAMGLIERYAGIAASAAGDWKAAKKHFRKALALATNLPHKIEEPKVLYWHARMLLDRNKNNDAWEAKKLLNRAVKLSHNMQLQGLVDQINKLL